MNPNAYYRKLLLEALKTAAAPLTLVELVDSANAVGMDGGAKPADLAGLSGRVASLLLRGMTSDGWVTRVQPTEHAAPLLRYALTGKGRAPLPTERVPPAPPFPRPVAVDMAAVRATTPARRKAIQKAQQRRADAFCRHFMDDTAHLINAFMRDATALRAKYERLYRELRDA